MLNNQECHPNKLRTWRLPSHLLARMGHKGDIPLLETNKLVSTGVYGCMRHPMHFGLLFFPRSRH